MRRALLAASPKMISWVDLRPAPTVEVVPPDYHAFLLYACCQPWSALHRYWQHTDACHALVWGSLREGRELRMTIIRIIIQETDIFGSWGHDSFQRQLDLAFQDFKAFLKEEKITCSQPPFTPGLAAWFRA